MERKEYIVSGMEDGNGVWRNKISEVADIASDYFSSIFTSQGNYSDPTVMSKVRNKLPADLNHGLTSTYTAAEIWDAIKAMEPLKAPGKDGFPALFYQKYCNIIGKDVAGYCLKILNGEETLEGRNHTNIVLIPKIDNPKTVSHYRPISLCSVLFKIISKVIANRLCRIIHLVIDEAQSGFVPGRLISDNIFVAYELIHFLKNKREGKIGKFALKLDMSKAYDRVEWNFIEAMLKEKGFDTGWIDLVMGCIRTVTYSVVINGKVYSHIEPSRGLRQGDPLSPYLFLICSEGFSTLLQMAAERGDNKGCKASQYGPMVTHLFFADDSLLFGEATEKGADCIKGILDLYSKLTGQCVNTDKSVVYFSPNTKDEAAIRFIEILGVRRVYNLDKYLGLPTMIGRKKRESFQYLKDRVYERIGSWSAKFLSQGGREVFIKAVLQSIPTYAMSCFLFPKTLCMDFNRIFNRFWWKQKISERGIYWCDWSKLSIPKKYGGMGFRDMLSFNIALLARQGWRLIMHPNSLVSRVLRAKYYRNSNYMKAQLGNNPSYTWKSVWSARGLIEKGLCWRVGDGESINVWADCWIPAKNNFRITYTGNNDRVEKVADLIDDERQEWNINLIQSIFDPREAQQILEIPLPHNRQPDDQIWAPNNTGTYSTKSGYKYLAHTSYRNNITNDIAFPNFNFYTNLWSLKLPPKVKILMWRISWNYLPTKLNLQIKHMASNSECPRCNNGTENLHHTFVDCSAIAGIWQKFGIAWPSFTSQIEFIEWLEEKSKTESSKILETKYTILWGIWSHRNRWVHESKHESMNDFFRFITTYIEEWQSSNSTRGTVRSITKNTIWDPPDEGTYKINVDAAYDKNSKHAGLGVIVRNHRGKCVAGSMKFLTNIANPCNAELMAVREGALLANQMQCNKFILESDCNSAVKRIRESMNDKSPSGRIIGDAMEIFKKMQHFRCQHIDRKANNIADGIAKRSMTEKLTRQWFEEPPDILKDLIQEATSN